MFYDNDNKYTYNTKDTNILCSNENKCVFKSEESRQNFTEFLNNRDSESLQKSINKGFGTSINDTHTRIYTSGKPEKLNDEL